MAEQPALKSFSPQVMLGNIGIARDIIQRIRKREGGIGSDRDELCIHRMIQDLDILVDIADGLSAAHSRLQSEVTNLSQKVAQYEGMKATYEKMVSDRNKRIIELETQLGIRGASKDKQDPA